MATWYEHLQEVNNGYGGRVRFTYADDGRWERVTLPGYGRTHYVIKTETWDGLNLTAAI